MSNQDQPALTPAQQALADYIIERLYRDAEEGRGPLAKVLAAFTQRIRVECSRSPAEVHI